MKIFARIVFVSFLMTALSVTQAYVHATDLEDYTWRQGEVVLMDGSKLTGEVAYDLKMDIIKINVDGRVKAFPPLKVRHFSYFDSRYRVKRSFYALPYTNELGYEVYRFFEVVYEGSLALLARTEKINKNAVSFAHDLFPRPTREPDMVKIDHFYLIFPDGNVQVLEGEEKQVFRILGHKSKLKKFIKKHRLELSRRIDLVKLMYYYDKITSGIASS